MVLLLSSVQLKAVTLLELKLKALKAEQLQQVVELDRICLGGLWTLEGYQRELHSPNSTLLALSLSKAKESNYIVGIGCFWAILEEAHVTILAVHPDYQGQGMGQLLLYALLSDAVKRNLERATLEVRESNKSALFLYHKFGFQTAGKRKGYYQQTGEDALILWRSGLNQPEFGRHLTVWQQQVNQRLEENQWQLIWGK